MMSKVLAFFVATALLLGSVSVALGDGFVAEARSGNAKLRAGGSMAHHTVAKLARGAKVAVVKQLGDWYVVRIPKDVPVYISSKWVRREAEDSGVVKGDRVNLRATPNTRYGALGVTYRGTVVKILGKTDGWLKIVPPDSALGWMYKTHLKRVGSIAKYGHEVNRGAYEVLRKKAEEKKTSVVNLKRIGALMDAAVDAVFLNDLDRAEELLGRVLADCGNAPATPLAAKAQVWLENVRNRKKAEVKRVENDRKREKKRQDLDWKFFEKMKKDYKAEVAKIKAKKPVYTATGTLKGLGLMVLRRGTHKLMDENGHEAYTLRIAPNSGIDLYDSKYFEKKVGVVGRVVDARGWPQKIIEVKRIDLLDVKKK